MSFDGKFSCAAALKRFLSRCPNLRSDPEFVALVRKAEALTADDVVAAMAEPFLHPEYTIPIVGCFRPLCGKILDRAVAKLSGVCSLESTSDEDSDDIAEGYMRVIDFYVERGRGLRLHELASLALCRALDLASFLLRNVQNYFKFSPEPFRRLALVGFAPPLSEKVHLFEFLWGMDSAKGIKFSPDYLAEKQLLDAIRVSYRFLIIEPCVFSELWDWTCFLDLVQRTSDIGALNAPSTMNNALDIRWCGIKVLSIVLKLSDKATENFGFGSDEALSCLLRFEEFCEDTSVEKAGCYIQAAETEQESCSAGINYLSGCCEVDYDILVSSSKSFVNECDMNDFQSRAPCFLPGRPFVLTPTIKRSFAMMLMAVGQKLPVLLHGPAGSGKTALINRLAEISGNHVLFIHMDEQMDSKTLIGTYICSEQPGEFRWHPGSLTQAILKGYWVAFEDIDKAPSEVQSIILPLLEGSSNFVTGHGEAISVGESFRLFATISTPKYEASHEVDGRLSFSTLWRKVLVETATGGDMTEIVNVWYPQLGSLIPRLIDTYDRVYSHASGQVGAIRACGVGSSCSLTRFTLRDLLKWCKRISDLNIKFSAFGLSVTDCRSIYQEAVDIFAAYLSSSQKRLSVIREIAGVWRVPLSELEHDYPSEKPVIQSTRSDLQVGRIVLPRFQITNLKSCGPFVGIRSTLHVLERVASSVKHNEPVLLVGETGTGKTTLVQNLAMILGQPLTVLNLSQQSDVADLLGGYKPADALSICLPLYQEFKDLFCRTFSEKENEARLLRHERYAVERSWKKLLNACQKSVDYVNKRFGMPVSLISGSKRKRPLSEKILHEWEAFSFRLGAAQKQLGAAAGVSFKFVEGAFVTALRNGHWILLDEVNLAPPETLQRISSVLDDEKGTLCLAERGDIDYINRHPSFRLFACMNPATDTGKRDLPYSLRSRFTEYFVDDVLDDNDLMLFVSQYLDDEYTDKGLSERIVHFYKAAKHAAEVGLQDGANQKPQFSLRSLARALVYAKTARKIFDFKKVLYDGFCMFFLTLLDGPSAKIMHEMIVFCILRGTLPKDSPFDAYFSVIKNSEGVCESGGFLKNYVLTKSVRENLRSLSRAVYIKKFPVLLQGPTSSGKTSLVHYLAAVTGHEFVRINNHEHTDLQEYFGTYITDTQGRLQFQEGALVKAVRHGYWIVLDELNLAPSDVLEALNRLLDDNRELFIPELQETIPAHPNFMLFATQNPPTLYGGRKMLSRAFRNRFIEIHVDEIPEDQLTEILVLRSEIPASYASKMVEVMKELQLHRQQSKVFAGKHGFITPRDLFRWANRFKKFGSSYEDLAKDGYLLLAERLRDENEKNVLRETLERHLRVKMNIDSLYMESDSDKASFKFSEHSLPKENLVNITWTKSMRRLFFLVERCYSLREPVLLIGETGGGKTTVCQLLSLLLKAKLHILNCHQYTETSDFIGGFYPVRDRSELANQFMQLIEHIKTSRFFVLLSGEELSPDITQASMTINFLDDLVNMYKKNTISHDAIYRHDLEVFLQLKMDLMQLHQKWQTIFLWQDGPLVQAMKNGDLLLVDEISLSDDSVLERLNSVLEPERKLLLAEKGGAVLEQITANDNFLILATMNPGGDYGKKELSPALRNRFTEIWVPPVSDVSELRSIATERFIKPDLSYLADYMLNFWEWFNKLHIGRTLTVRDMLSWVSFVNVTEQNLGPAYALLHGSFLVLLDGLSLGTNMSKHDAKTLREHALTFLVQELMVSDRVLNDLQMTKLENFGWGDKVKQVGSLTCNGIDMKEQFGIEPFYIPKGKNECKHEGFEFLAPTTSRNVMRVLRAMQLSKPVLLEGSPGVGKTSLVVALAEYSGNTVVRINLSEQTDIMDLLGSDLPTQRGNRMEFSWSDGILLKALKEGSWVLLDELNLAPQSVLEGLNSILDHRAEVFIPELSLTFKCPPSFRIFGCQNPSYQGGGRKSLPKSFLNRFTKVYVNELDADDYLFICRSKYPTIPQMLLSKLICFNNRMYEDTMIYRKYGQEGAPWEFNLRDVLRSCKIIKDTPKEVPIDRFLNIVYLQRMRTVADRYEVLKLYEEVFGSKPSLTQFSKVHVNPRYLIIGSACAKRNHFQPSKVSKSHLYILPGLVHSLEVALHCVQQQWLCIVVGPYSSGKTSLIRLLAQLTGNVLHELNLSPGTDVTDLLGCFEQYNVFRSYRDVITRVEHYVEEYFSLRLEQDWKALIKERKNLFSKWFAFLASSRRNSHSSSSFPQTWKHEYLRALDLLIDIIKQLQLDKQEFSLQVSWSEDDLNELLRIVTNMQKIRSEKKSLNFEWVSGVLIKAIKNGEWIVLENANLCNPTVLDRINSLFEPNGSITINECGLSNGEATVLQGHPNFRLFLTVNPKHGEVSRAMRNRGVELFMMNPTWLPNENDNADIDRNDVKLFLTLSGIPCSKLVSAMTDAHMYAKSEGLRLGVRITLRELSHWVQLFQKLLLKGNQPKWSLQLSWDHIYLSSFGETEGKHEVLQAKLSYLSDTDWYGYDEISAYTMHLPKGWPSPVTLRNMLRYSRETCLRENCLYLEFLASRYASSQFYNSTKEMLELHMNPKVSPYVLPINMVCHLLFPDSYGNQNVVARTIDQQLDLDLANMELFFAANWSVEQAMESDVSMYVLLIKWYRSRIHPYCQFLNYFLDILEQERDHSIWICIRKCWKEAIAYHNIDTDARPVAMLSLEVTRLASVEVLKNCHEFLNNAGNCVRLLRLTYWQWAQEMGTSFVKGTLQFSVLTILNCLKYLEVEALEVIMNSEEHQNIYAELIGYHRLFWKNLMSPNHDLLPVAWNFLRKQIMNLKPVFPNAVDAILDEILKLNNKQISISDVGKPILWLHGGHPFVPSSADVYYKMQQLITFCDVVWPRTKLFKQNFTDHWLVMNTILSSDLDLRQLALQALCMSSFIARNSGLDYAIIVSQIDEIYQGLLGRFELGRKTVELASGPGVRRDVAAIEHSTISCCSFCFQDLSRKEVFDSWLVTLPLFDIMSFLLDMELLNKLTKSILADSSEIHEVLLKLSDWLTHSLKYSINSSSRPPIDFTSHQMILWILDAWKTVDSVHAVFASFLMDMWFKFHTSIWNFSSMSNPGLKGNFDESCFLVLPSRTVIIDRILEDSMCVKDYGVHCLKLRVSARCLWQVTSLPGDIFHFLHSAVDSLFKQIIFVHHKYFPEDVFRKIKSILSRSFQSDIQKVDINNLKSLISSSNHPGLNSLVDLLVEPLLTDLYIKPPSCDFLYNLGCAWFRVGMLRFCLLNQDGVDSPDPVLKYSVKHSNILDRISLLELETKVYRECERLSGSQSTICKDNPRLLTLQNLEVEEKQLRAKVVFRPEHFKHRNLRLACANFGDLLSSCLKLVNDLKMEANVDLVANRLCNCQATMSSFIKQLSEEFAECIDLIQPIQVAVYEMKLGLSLALSSALERDYLKKLKEEDIQKILADVYSFMQFPGSWMNRGITIKLKNSGPDFINNCLFASETTSVCNINVLKKLVNNYCERCSDKLVSSVRLENTIHYVVFIQSADHVSCSRMMDKDCFLLLNGAFDHFSKLWMGMKSELKAKEYKESQYFKFKPRLTKLDDIMEEDISTLSELGYNEQTISDNSKIQLDFSEMKKPAKEDERADQEWDLIPESMLNSLVHVHYQLFGAIDLVEKRGIYYLSKEERLRSFLESYKLGTIIMKDLAAFTSISDDKLVLEHLLRVCLEYEGTLGIASPSSQGYNIYKDSNSSELYKMVKPLTVILERVELFLNEWPDHPGLQNLRDVIDKLLSTQFSTPLSKALLNLQLVVGKAEFLQENVSAFSFKDLLHPIYALISSWHKIELGCWPTLLDEIQDQYEINAAKLCFPLYAVLHRGSSGDAEADKCFTVQSVEEFIESSNIGEFKKRLDLLLAFHGQLRHGVNLKVYSSSMRENLKILYNAFGYYVQFLPIVLEHVENGRKSIEKELKELLKLFHWEHSHDYTSMENFSRFRQKIRKLIQKFNDILQQPLMHVLNQEAVSRREKIPPWLENCTCDEKNIDVLQFPVDVMKLSDTERFLWYNEWKGKANILLKTCFSEAQVSGLSDLRQSLLCGTPNNDLKNLWMGSWSLLERICNDAAQFAHIWKHGIKNNRKKNALRNLLKGLEQSGLSRHKSVSNEQEIKLSYAGSTLYHQSSYDMLHLLLQDFLHKYSRDIRITSQSQSEKPDCIIIQKLKSANQFYFRNLATMNQLREICLNFNKDLSLEQVTAAISFLTQLITMQQEQRDVLYNLFEHLKKLKRQFHQLNGKEESGNLIVAVNQPVLYVRMWEQKQLFDSLLIMSRDTITLLEYIKSSHLNSCKAIIDEVDEIRAMIDEFTPRFLNSKESLDRYLFGNDEYFSVVSEVPFIVSKQMEDLVLFNFETINAFEEAIQVLGSRKSFSTSVVRSFLNRFEDLINKDKMKGFISHFDEGTQIVYSENDLEADYTKTYDGTIGLLMDACAKLCTPYEGHIPSLELSASKITLWKPLLLSCMKNLRMKEIHDALSSTIISTIKVEAFAANKKNGVCSLIQMRLKNISDRLELILTFGDGILSEFLDWHAAIAEVTNVLAHIFTLVFSKGFGSTQEEPETTMCNGSKDASGTGMGEGEGINDVSDQIEDEAQLLGSSEKEQDNNSGKVPNENDRGIEMEEDFDAEAFSMSGDSDDDNNGGNEEEVNLDSQMGQTADGDQVVDEKHWDGGEDDKTESLADKYESGPSVEEIDSTSRELRAKDDNALAKDDSEKNENDTLSEEDKESARGEDYCNSDEMVHDKSQAFDDPTGIQLQEQTQELEDVDMDEPQGSDLVDESDSGSMKSDEEMEDVGENPKEPDGIDDGSYNQVDNNSQNNEEDKDENTNMETKSNEETISLDKMELFQHPSDGKESNKFASTSHRIDSTMESEMHLADNNDINSSIAPTSLPSDEMPNLDILLPTSAEGSKISYKFELKPEDSQDSSSSLLSPRTNPYRSLGDAMEEWKERVRVSDDTIHHPSGSVDDIAEVNADEYGFVPETEKSTSQALAAARSDQMSNNLDGSKSSMEGNNCRENHTDQGELRENSDPNYLKSRQLSVIREKVVDVPDVAVETDVSMEETEQIHLPNIYQDTVSFKSALVDNNLDTSQDEKFLSRSMGIEEPSEAELQNAVSEWKRYEMVTTRLSQELAEQLRLVMEPSLASKLQGDYKTGKRINMKKVIPYIASHFRKDKIWLRRTKPNKRNYQVVVSIDDSRSMSESQCGNAAIEALVSVCRAMSQLEVGQFAVASFGKKGNVRLLHDFDQPFTGEAGVKIISNLSFKQDNNIDDEPLVDLLKYLNNMLDSAVSKARIPSGQNPLNQLILVIADGRINEKENLKRYVRDMLNRKRLIAFILIDNPQQSIIHLEDAFFEGNRLSFKKYLNTFPFPYYIILRNNEALPRTLADLLRQWFELTQNVMD